MIGDHDFEILAPEVGIRRRICQELVPNVKSRWDQAERDKMPSGLEGCSLVVSINSLDGDSRTDGLASGTAHHCL